MRYPCYGFPACLKTFENGHVQHAHQLSCEHAIIKTEKFNQRQEHAHTIQYSCRYQGTKANQFYPTHAGLDNTQKFLIRDRHQLGGNNDPQQSYRKSRKVPDPKLVLIQTKSTSLDFSGYYT